MRILLLVAILYSTPLLAFAQDVVINKYKNGILSAGEGDIVELLVIRDGLDMRGYILRDFAITDDGFSTDSVTTGTGSFRFSNNSLWQRLRAGTIIVLPNTTQDLQRLSDTVYTVGLKNTFYFSSSGTFNIGSNDMVMLKRSDAPIGGIVGNIHALSAGLSMANIAGITPIVYTLSEMASTARPFAVPDNIAGNLNDYNGNRAGTITNAIFGLANNVANQRFIDSLRGTRAPVTSVRGNGSALARLTLAPTPTSDDCVVSFQMTAPDVVEMWLIDALGNRRKIYHSYHSAGEQTIRFSLADVAVGAYVMAIRVNNIEWGEKMAIMK